MIAYRIGNKAFVMREGELVVEVQLDTFEAARKAVADFNAGRHSVIGRGY